MEILDLIEKQNKKDSIGQKKVYTKTEGSITEFYIKDYIPNNEGLFLQAIRFTFTKKGWMKKNLLNFPNNLIERRIKFQDFKKVSMIAR
jgi:hypothetical protein